MDELPMDQLFAFAGWALANDGWMQFNGIGLDEKGYVAQEIKKLVDVAKKVIREKRQKKLHG